MPIKNEQFHTIKKKHDPTHITQYLKKHRQSDNEIWSVNKIQREKHFKNHAENETGRPVPNILFFKRDLLKKVTASGQYLSYNI